MPASHLEITRNELQKVIAPNNPLVMDRFSKLLDEDFCYLWSMMQKSQFAGMEHNGFGTVRLQISGFRTILFF